MQSWFALMSHAFDYSFYFCYPFTEHFPFLTRKSGNCDALQLKVRCASRSVLFAMLMLHQKFQHNFTMA